LGTRLLAHQSDALRRADAQIWFARGQDALKRSDIDAAVTDFRLANLKRRGQKEYVLQYVDAQRRSGQIGQARRALLALRESIPDDVDVNLALARLAADQGDYGEASRYYRNALYAPWPDAAARRQARFEFIRLLLQHGEMRLARAELLAASDNLPDTAAAHVEAGSLFAAAGDASGAREHYSRALSVEPGNAAALLGAGRAAFEVKDFAGARRLLRKTGLGPADERKLQISELVVELDPLATRLSRNERLRRMRRLLDVVGDRLKDCRSNSGATPAVESLLEQTRAASVSRVTPSRVDESSDEALRLAVRAIQVASSVCAAVPLDEAVSAMSAVHERDEP
jgi:tetratricopeptide (TPR) repeat protein